MMLQGSGRLGGSNNTLGNCSCGSGSEGLEVFEDKQENPALNTRTQLLCADFKILFGLQHQKIVTDHSYLQL